MSEYVSRSLEEIITDSIHDNASRALECLENVSRLPSNDLARPEYLSAAQTFALLAIVDSLRSSTGAGIADTISRVGGMR